MTCKEWSERTRLVLENPDEGFTRRDRLAVRGVIGSPDVPRDEDGRPYDWQLRLLEDGFRLAVLTNDFATCWLTLAAIERRTREVMDEIRDP